MFGEVKKQKRWLRLQEVAVSGEFQVRKWTKVRSAT